MTAFALEVRNLHVELGGQPVLEGVSLSVPAGEAVAVLGPSGCGKTTLLRAIAGLVRISAGEIQVGGSPVATEAAHLAPERRGVGLVFQDLALWPHMTVAGNLDFVLEAQGVPRGDRPSRRVEVSAAVGFPASLLERRPGELSGGERQRAALARALAQRPDVLLLDEPLTGLDAHLRRRFLVTLEAIRRTTGLAILLVTHDREEAFALADEIVVLDRGRVAQQGTPETVYGTPASPFVAEFVGDASCLAVERVDGSLRTSLGTWDADDAPGGAVIAVFRPETVRLADDGAARGTVRAAFYRGGRWLLDVDVNGEDVLVESAGNRKPGVQVGLTAARPSFVPANAARRDR